MAIGDDALDGKDENIQMCTFSPVDHERTIWFKGYNLMIYHNETKDKPTNIRNNPPTDTCDRYTVPAGYHTHVRGGTARFEG